MPTLTMPTPLELSAMLFTVGSIYFAVKRNIFTYPVGIIGTILYGVLYASFSLPLVILQVVFTIDQIYGWWFWKFGDQGKVPRISHLGADKSIGSFCATLAVFSVVGFIVKTSFPGLKMGVIDTQILGLSLLAQFMLDRKWIENWWVWLVVNPLTVVYAFQNDLGATALLSVLLTVNVAWGLIAWRREYDGYSPGERWQDENKKALDGWNKYVEKNGLPLEKYRTS